jgi:hypothetical protein
MHKVDTLGSVNGTFTDTNPATVVDDDWLNAVQAELVNVIEACGITLVKGTNTQLLAACVAAATANKIVRRDANGRAQFADPSAAQDADTKAARDAAIAAIQETSAVGSLAAGWGSDGTPANVVSRTGKVAGINLRLRASGTPANWINAIGTVPVGFRPAQLVLLAGYIDDWSAGKSSPCMVRISPAGAVSVDSSYNAASGSFAQAPTAADGDALFVTGAWPIP